MARDPAAQVEVDDPMDVARLLEVLRWAGASDAACALADRAAAQASLGDPDAVARLLEALRWAGASDAICTLLARDPAAQVSLDKSRHDAQQLKTLRRGGQVGFDNDNSRDIIRLLEALREAGASAAVTALTTRAANVGMFDIFLGAHRDKASNYLLGREPDGDPSQSWRWQEPTTKTVATDSAPRVVSPTSAGGNGAAGHGGQGIPG